MEDCADDIRLCGQDGYPGWLHTLLLVDDTVILATTREKAIEEATVIARVWLLPVENSVHGW